MTNKWTWMVCHSDMINPDCEHMESEGWEVVSIVLTREPFYRVFMRQPIESEPGQ